MAIGINRLFMDGWRTAAAGALIAGLVAAAPAGSSPAPTTQAASAAQQQTVKDKAASPANQAVTRHLSEARRTLSELASSPEGAQLTGEARTKVSTLITDFNALLTSKSDWKTKYEAVDRDLFDLLGPPPGSEAVGTSGRETIVLDPAVTMKLEALRRHLTAFYAAAAGAPPPSAAPSAAAPPASPSPAPPAATPAPPEPPSSSPPPAEPPAAVPPAPPKPPTEPPAEEAAEPRIYHLDQIDTILNEALAPGAAAGTPGTAPPTTGSVIMDRAKLEAIRSHVDQLRQLLKKPQP